MAGTILISFHLKRYLSHLLCSQNSHFVRQLSIFSNIKYGHLFSQTTTNRKVMEMCHNSTSSSQPKSPNLLMRFKNKMFGISSDRTKVTIGACLSYEKCVDDVDFKTFVDHFQVPDTFQTWFVVMTMHVWMVTITVVSENNGRLFRNFIVGAMWDDVEQRVSHLVKYTKSQKKSLLTELNAQFRASLISYDEGFMSDDMSLAASAWRTFFAYKYIDPQILESMVLYMRKQVSHIESLNLDDIMYRGKVEFLPLKAILEDKK